MLCLLLKWTSSSLTPRYIGFTSSDDDIIAPVDLLKGSFKERPVEAAEYSV